MKTKNVALIPLALVLGCAGSPSGPVGTPDVVASQLMTHLDSGDFDDADDLFDRVREDEEYRQRIYPILFSAARESYATDDPSQAVDILSFMAGAYPDAVAVREALVYSLFLRRAQLEEADPGQTAEIDQALSDLRQRSTSPPIWLDLVEAQQAIDKDELPAARAALAAFLGSWTGEPPSLLLYVEDIERYLRSH